MESNSEENFVFGSDDDGYEDSLQSQRLDRLNLKVTLLTILVPSVLIVLFIFMYMDMKDKVVQVHNTGTSEVQQSAEELKKIIDELKTSQKDLEKRLNEKIAAMENTLAPIKKHVDQHQKDIDYLASVKIDKKTLNSETTALKGSIDAIKKDMATLTEQNGKLVAIAQELQGRINAIPAIQKALEGQKASMDSMESTLGTLNTELASLKKQSVGNQELATELKKQKAFYRLEMDDMEMKLNKKIDAVKKSIPATAPSGSAGSKAP